MGLWQHLPAMRSCIIMLSWHAAQCCRAAAAAMSPGFSQSNCTASISPCSPHIPLLLISARVCPLPVVTELCAYHSADTVR